MNGYKAHLILQCLLRQTKKRYSKLSLIFKINCSVMLLGNDVYLTFYVINLNLKLCNHKVKQTVQ